MSQVLIQETDFQRARNKIREARKSEKQIIFTSKDDELNRKILEKEKIDVLLLSLSGRKDKMKQRDSGFNQVLAKAAKKKNTIIGINLGEILNAKSPREKSDILARIEQNIKICSKNKIKMKFFPEKDKYDIRSLALVLGMPTWMTKNL